ncbi:hypothetical protein A2U01_0077514, partial [Trifolium medium]|nr:hypothetical protein [Trifolium medium]
VRTGAAASCRTPVYSVPEFQGSW